jgi:hypothetical protein
MNARSAGIMKLGRRLQDLMNIKDRPFHHYNREKGFVAKFKLLEG